jgi:glycosyltransferase involved in cell wall biosynthesis
MKCNYLPLVSIIIPTYNDAINLQRSLQSVANQSYKNWEIVVVDNNSTDNTDEVISYFSDSAIRLQKISNNGVIAASRNMGIQSSTGEWVAFLDSDDLWYPDKLRVSIEAILNNENVDIFSTDEMVVDELTGREWKLKHGTNARNVYRSLLTDGNCLSPSAIILRRKFLMENHIFFREDTKYIMSEDYDFWLRLAKNGARFYFIDSVQGQYTIHDKNASNKFELFQKNSMNVVRDHVFNVQDFCIDKDQLWRKLRVKYDFSQMIFLFKNKKYQGSIIIALNIFYDSFWNAVVFMSVSLYKKIKNI